MNFDEVGLQDPVIGYVAATNIWPADDYAQACALYEQSQKDDGAGDARGAATTSGLRLW